MATPAAAVELHPGSRFGGYRIDAAVGRGGMATVYRAEHVHLRRPVALKVPTHELAEDAAFRDRFIRESRIAGTLAHPNLVAVYDAGEIDGVLYLAMQFVEGEDLARALKRDGALEPARAIDVIAQIASGLDAAHDRGLVHRDIKPANVLMDGAHCLVADFGLTKVADGRVASVAGELLGTLSYAPPEQIEGVGIDRRADIYALGTTAYECLVGETPFAHRRGAALLYAQITETPPRASERRPGLPHDVDAVLMRALAKDPEDRYTTCGEFAAALGEALASRAAETPREQPVVPTGVPFPPALERCREQPLVGRERELAALGEFGDQRVVVALAGEPGIGKTRLAGELAAQAYSAGAIVLYGRADEDPVVPYEAFVEGLRHLSAHVDVTQLPPEVRSLAPLVPELAHLGPPAESGEAGTDRYRMFEGVVALLSHVGRSAPVLLVLEDLQWAEKATLLLLRHVLESPRPSRLAAVVSYRPLWVGDEHPLRDSLTNLARTHDVRHVTLGGLTEEETGRLAADRLGSPPPSELIEALFRRTSGNPLFLKEILREASLEDTATTLPANVRHVVRRRLQRLSSPTRDVLTVAALLQDDVSRADLAALTEVDVDEALDEALTAHVVVEIDGRFALTHSLIRDVLVSDLPRAERRRRHHDIAEVLARRGGEPAAIARHFLAARDAEESLRWGTEAARAASQAHGHEPAAAILGEVQELLDERDTVDPAERRDLLLDLGDARLRASQPRCVETFGAAADLSRLTGDPEGLAVAALGLAGRVIAPGLDSRHVPILEEALAGLDRGDSALRVRVLARLAQSVPEARALELSAEAMDMAERLDDDGARLAALAGRHAAVADLTERADIGRAWVALADRTGDLEAAALARNWHLLDLLETPDRAAVNRELVVLEELAGRLHQPLYEYAVLVWRSVLATLDGRPAAADTSRALAVAEQMRIPDPGGQLARHIERLTAVTGGAEPRP